MFRQRATTYTLQNELMESAYEPTFTSLATDMVIVTQIPQVKLFLNPQILHRHQLQGSGEGGAGFGLGGVSVGLLIICISHVTFGLTFLTPPFAFLSVLSLHGNGKNSFLDDELQ